MAFKFFFKKSATLPALGRVKSIIIYHGGRKLADSSSIEKRWSKPRDILLGKEKAQVMFFLDIAPNSMDEARLLAELSSLPLLEIIPNRTRKFDLSFATVEVSRALLNKKEATPLFFILPGEKAA